MLRKKITLGIITLSGAYMALGAIQPHAAIRSHESAHHQNNNTPIHTLSEEARVPMLLPDSIELPDSAHLEQTTYVSPSDSLDMGAIPTINLDELVITGVATPIVAKQDTLEFNAGSFKTVSNATVEDLLKRLPGVEVGSDGSITSGGKSITKILVDGKEFFADDPQLATKNLPSDMVDKVQVIDRKSDLARLTGIDDGDDETVINLKVKKNMNNGWFGNISASYSPIDNRYEASGVANWFANGNQVSIIAGGNNINEMGFGDMGRGRFSSFGQGNGGVLTSQRFGVNFNVGNDDKFRIGGNIFYAHSDRDSRSRSETQYLFPDYTNYNKGGNLARDKGHSVRADLRMQWNIDQNNTLEFRPRFSVEFRNSMMNDSTILAADKIGEELINRNFSAQTNKGTSWSAQGNLLFNHKFANKPGRSFSITANYAFSKTLQKGTSWSDIEYYLKNEDSEELLRYLDSEQWSNTIGGRLSWTEPLGDPARGNFLDISYGISYRFNNADKLTYNLNPDLYADSFGNMPVLDHAPEGLDFDPTLSNRFRNNYFSQELQVGYKKVSKKLNLNVGLMFAPASSQSTDIINPERNIPTRWVWNLGPFARIRIKFNDNSSLNIRYRSRTSQPSLTALQPVEDVSNPLNIIKGNPDLKPTFTQNINVMFNNYSSVYSQSVAAMIHASYALNSVVQRTIYNAETGGRYTTYANANGDFSLRGMGMFSRVLPNNHFYLNTRLNLSFISSPGYIDGDFNRTANIGIGPSAGITYTNDWLQASINPTYSYGLVTNTLKGQTTRNTHSYGFTSNIVATLPFGLQLSTDLAFSNSSGYAQGFNSASWLWNAQVSYSFLANKQLTLFAKAYDILGLKKNISRTTSASMIVDREINDLSRYVMIGLTWNFSTLKKGMKIPEEDFRHMGPPDGHHEGGQRPKGTRGMRGDGPMGPPSR